MKISFEITANDVVAANLLHCAHSPATRGMRRLFSGTGPLIAILIIVFSLLSPRNAPTDLPQLGVLVGVASLLGGA
jgi:hypothetical protein